MSETFLTKQLKRCGFVLILIVSSCGTGHPNTEDGRIRSGVNIDKDTSPVALPDKEKEEEPQEKITQWRWCHADERMQNEVDLNETSIGEKCEVVRHLIETAVGAVVVEGIDDEMYNEIIPLYVSNFLNYFENDKRSQHETLNTVFAGYCYIQTCCGEDVQDKKEGDGIVAQLFGMDAEMYIDFLKISESYYRWYDSKKIASEDELKKLDRLLTDFEMTLERFFQIGSQKKKSKCYKCLAPGKHKLLLSAQHYVSLIKANDRTVRYDAHSRKTCTSDVD